MPARTTKTPDLPTITGCVRIHPRGFGFLEWIGEHGERLSAFLAPRELKGLLDGDVIRARIGEARDHRLSAVGPELLERTRTRLYGEVVSRGGRLWLHPDPEVANSDFPLVKDEVGTKPGDTIVAHLTGEGLRVERCVADPAERGLERVIARHELAATFHGAVEGAAREARRRPHALSGRRDLRDLPTVTIDGPSTRDIDDALGVLPAGEDGVLHLLVSISDVAECVTAGSPLDDEAARRGTSVYLAGRVLPMLPDDLSTDWLSLLPGQDRRCLTVELRIDPEGRILSTDVYESLMRSAARLTYGEVAAYLDRGQIPAALAPVAPMLPWLRAADARLAVARAQKGGLLLERDEARVTFDARTGMACGLEIVPTTTAHALVERCMVAANTAMAEWLADRGVPAPYRVHDHPLPDRARDLAEFATRFGLVAGFGPSLTPLALAAFDLQVRGKDGEPALRSVMRRLLGPARYTVQPGPHFGLAASKYLHFTSPIRRYADLLVHRAVKQYLHGRRDFVAADPAIEEACRRVNELAVRAGRAENDRLRAAQAEVMAARVGERHGGRVTRVRPFGLVVQLDDIAVEGTLPLDALPEGPYQADERETVLAGPGGTFTLGMRLEVRVAGADPLVGRIELALA
jgi:ribonuclease R